MIEIFVFWLVFILSLHSSNGIEIPYNVLLLQKQKCPYTQMRAGLHEKLKKLENTDTMVNLGIAVMILVVMVSSSLL